jgi:hypothetical protein
MNRNCCMLTQGALHRVAFLLMARFRATAHLVSAAGLAACLFTPLTCQAEGSDFSWPDSNNYTPQALWLNAGDLSYHFQSGENFRGDNWGFGAQIDFPHDLSLLGGTFINSDRQRSYDAGVLWEPYSIGPVKLGAVAGGFNGYPYFRNGAWFPALLPMASASYQSIGANVTILPNYKNKLHGALVVQLIFKVW